MIRKLPHSPVPIIQQDNPVLRQIARKIEDKEFGSPTLADTIKRMNAALDSQEDGVAIAAPQIGESIRMFIVAKKAFAFEIEDEKEGEKKVTKNENKILQKNKVFINPKITRQSKETQEMEEGCLSVRFLYGSVRRKTKVTVEAFDEAGTKFTYHGSKLLAEIFQHEIDHLDGILFVDKATDVRELLPEHHE